jgi:predicted DNA-binding protein (UPF0251 family)
VGRQTVSNIARHYVPGGPSVVPPRRHPPAKLAEAVRLCRAGANRDATAARLGISRTTLYNALRNAKEATREAAGV